MFGNYVKQSGTGCILQMEVEDLDQTCVGGRMILVKVALIGRSNHWCMNRRVMESRFLVTHVLARLATVRYQESFESKYRWYKSNLFFGRIERLSILVSISTRKDCNVSL